MGAELVEFEPGRAVLALPVREAFRQRHGFAFAGGSVLGADVVTVEFKVSYLRPARGERLLARAVVEGSGKRIAVCRCDVVSVEGGHGRPCAVAQGTIALRAWRSDAPRGSRRRPHAVREDPTTADEGGPGPGRDGPGPGASSGSGVPSVDDPRLEALGRELLQARRHLGDLLGLPVPLEPEDGPQAAQARLTELAREAHRLQELAARLGGEAQRVLARVRRIESELHGAGYPTV